MPKTRPYLFYDVAISICSTCYRKVEAKTVFQNDNVYLLKRCPQHGPERVLIADDIDYYRRCREVFLKPPEMPRSTTLPSSGDAPTTAASAPTTSSTPASPLSRSATIATSAAPSATPPAAPNASNSAPSPKLKRCSTL